MHTPDERHEGQNWSQNPESSDFMTLHTGSNPESRKAGYELADANVKDTAIFLVVMAAVLCVVFVVAFGVGKLLYYEIGQTDGPPNKWSTLATHHVPIPADALPLPSSPSLWEQTRRSAVR